MAEFVSDVEKMSAYAVGCKVYGKWGMNPAHEGAQALLHCGAVAAARTSRGESWSAAAVSEDYAAWRGSTAKAVRAAIAYALRAAGLKVGPVGAVIILGHTRVVGGC